MAFAHLVAGAVDGGDDEWLTCAQLGRVDLDRERRRRAGGRCGRAAARDEQLSPDPPVSANVHVTATC